ncbi:MAG TPA: efflux RND transporter permease subunit [Myxococcota bacterium]|nr:efflux RND transporter permease subunit [Myxococcota bacterium]HQK49774.1 efflux RND transporter permease subunit [Myxococcota bacterium]
MLTRASLRNRVAVAMISIAVIVLGWVSLQRIPVDLFPDITFPVVVVGVPYPGAGPKDVEASITKILERAVSAVPNVTDVESTSRQGLAIIRANFAWGADVDVGASDTIQRVQQVMASLPLGTQQPFVIKMDLSNIAVVGLTVEAEDLDERAIYDLAYQVIQPQIERLDGVSTASISGGLVRQIRIEASRDALMARGLTVQDVVNTLAQANFLMPSGTVRLGPLEWNVFTETQIPVIERLGDLVVQVGAPGRLPVFLRDVATIQDAAEDATNVVRINGRNGVNLWVRKQPGANTIAVVDRVLAALPGLRGLPAGVTVRPAFDQATYIRNSIRSLVREALMGALLAVVVMLLFLRSVRSTLVIALSIPLSMMATFVLLYFLGNQSLNTFTLGGLALGVGRLVDDSIVVLENIFRHRTRGASAVQAALDGAREVAMPVLASTIATIAVFFPVIYLAGIAKMLFIPLTLAIIFALGSSYFVSMGVIPPLTLRFVRPLQEPGPEDRGPRARLMRLWGRGLGALEDGYAAVLQRVLRLRAVTILGLLGLFAGSMTLFPRLGTDFFPATDESQVIVNLRGPIGTRVERTVMTMDRMEAVIRQALGDANIQAVIGDAGVRTSGGGVLWSGNSGPHSATLRVRLVPPDRRPFSDREAVERIRGALGTQFAGYRVFMDAGGIVRRIMNFGSEAPIDVEVIGYDLEDARRLTEQVTRLVEETPGTTDVRFSREDDYPEFDVRVDREHGALLGVTAREVAQTVLTSMAGNLNQPGIYTDPRTGDEYHIVVRLAEADRNDVQDLEDLPVSLRTGRTVPLRTIATVEASTGPIQIDRKYQQRIVHVTANVLGRPVGDVAADIEKGLRNLPLPEGFEVRLGGQRAQQKESFQSLLLALVLALMLVYMVLASQFRSLLEPFVVMFSVPMGLVGVVWALFLTGTPLSVNAFMGIIMMVGIVVSNGILLVEFANLGLEQGLDPIMAVIEAGRVRLRPILMTTLTTLLGLLPMAVGIGEGSESNVPLARAVVGGLLASTVFTLVLVPTLYTVLRRRPRKDLLDQEPSVTG